MSRRELSEMVTTRSACRTPLPSTICRYRSRKKSYLRSTRNSARSCKITTCRQFLIKWNPVVRDKQNVDFISGDCQRQNKLVPENVQNRRLPKAASQSYSKSLGIKTKRLGHIIVQKKRILVCTVSSNQLLQYTYGYQFGTCNRESQSAGKCNAHFNLSTRATNSCQRAYRPQ